MEVRSSSPSSFRRSRSAMARTATVALSLVAGSLTFWSSVSFVAPNLASAAPVPLSVQSCQNIFGSWWYLGFEGFSGGTIDIGADQVTIESQVPSSDLSDFELRVQFYPDDKTCSDFSLFVDPSVNETIDRPTGLSVCVASQSSTGSMGTFVARPWWWDSLFGTSVKPEIDVVQGSPRSFASLWVTTDDGPAPIPDDVEGRFEVKEIAGDPSDPYPVDPAVDVDIKIVFGANPVCTFSTPDNDEPAGGFDFDIEHYRNRAASEVGALPDTL